jgi:hypothetical protein
MYGAFCPYSRPLFFNNIQQEAPWRLGVLKGVHGDLVYTFTKPWSDAGAVGILGEAGSYRPPAAPPPRSLFQRHSFVKKITY